MPIHRTCNCYSYFNRLNCSSMHPQESRMGASLDRRSQSLLRRTFGCICCSWRNILFWSFRFHLLAQETGHDARTNVLQWTDLAWRRAPLRFCLPFVLSSTHATKSKESGSNNYRSRNHRTRVSYRIATGWFDWNEFGTDEKIHWIRCRQVIGCSRMSKVLQER